ncbi:ABC transporter ATP-binding protein [Actinomadura syzygii]|uniref:ATP-binding cassette domain-containing protein n=1 Tax=Actinomadura syzygii TaxID=1427538 RepID=A0A5D0TMT4_9ACTN|nr:ATP-binding cassette domain-containing protein [Actinomadura syzygii]TYC07591.1 ATP-binding cassette domain-containing protein [Actinomadura syzygii]
MLELNKVRLVHNQGTSTEVVALHDLSLKVDTGQFVTVVGANGAGKSSMIQVISGAARPTSGTVRIGGADVTLRPDFGRARQVARVFDDPRAGTAPELSIEENLALAMSRGRRRRLRFAVTRSRRSVMREHLKQLGLGLEERLSAPVALLSAGQRQSLTMIMAGLTQPDVLLLDEHLAALDPGTAQRVLALTVDLSAELSCTSVMITHNMEQAISVGDRLLVMGRGRVIADISGAEKASLTVPGLVSRITEAGAEASDRMMLSPRSG